MAFQKPKLHGRAFYESIGSPRVVLAPMVDQSEFAWRMLTRSFLGNQEQACEATTSSLLAYTPMLHSRIFQQDAKYRRKSFEAVREASTLPTASISSEASLSVDSEADDVSQTPFLDGNIRFDRPLTVQFCSNSPSDLLAAAKHVAPYCDAVDLNLGCPQGIARRGHYGAFLQEDWSLIYNMVNTLHKNLEIPVTAKMRVLDTKVRTLEYAQMLLDAGASIIAVHGRRREQKGHLTGVADWQVIRYLRESLPAETVIFANGNILQYEDIAACLDATGADAIMSAEGNLSDPSIFASPPPLNVQNREYWRGDDGKGGFRMDAMFRKYLDIVYRFVLEIEPPKRKPLFIPSDHDGMPSSISPYIEQRNEPERLPKHEKPQSPNLLAMRPHLFHMLRPLISKYTHVRDALARTTAGHMPAFEYVLDLVEQVIAEAVVEYARGNTGVAEHAKKEQARFEPASDIDATESSLETVRRCWRPWWICQPYVRPLPAEAVAKGSVTLSAKDRGRVRSTANTDQFVRVDDVVTSSDPARDNAVSRDTLVAG